MTNKFKDRNEIDLKKFLLEILKKLYYYFLFKNVQKRNDIL